MEYSSLKTYRIGSPITFPERSAAKKEYLELTSRQKQALYGSDLERRAIATAQMNGNDLGQQPDVRELTELDPLEFAAKYGPEAAVARNVYGKAYQDLATLLDRERPRSDVIKDSAIDAGLAVTNVLGSTAALGTLVGDKLLSAPADLINTVAGEEVIQPPEPLTPFVSQGLQWINEQGRSNQSQLMQERRAQVELAKDLDRQDREAEFGEGKGVLNWLKKQGDAFYDTIENTLEDPIITGSIVPEGIASVAGFAGLIRTAGRRAVIAELRAAGKSNKEISDYLKTKAGREAVDAAAQRAAPAVIGAAEGGSALTQTQQEILSMPEAELAKSEIYQGYIDAGMKPDQAREEMAMNQGTIAAISAIPGAVVAGKIAAPFAANPLRTRGSGTIGSSIAGGARNTAAETVEETLQEANTQLASNIGLRSGDIDVALDEGVAEAGAIGALGGALSAGPLQVPGVAFGTTAEALRSAGRAASNVLSARDAQLDQQADDVSAVGTAARTEAAETAAAAGAALLDSVTPNQTTEEAEEAPAPSALTQSVQNALFLDEAEATSPLYEGTPRTDTGQISRFAAMETASQILDLEDVSTDAKLISAASIISDFNSVRSVASTEATAEVESLAPDAVERQAYTQLVDSISTFESSGILEKAQEYLKNVSAEDVAKIIDFSVLQDETIPEADRAGLEQIIAAIAQVNPEAVPQNQYDTVLNQTTGLNQDNSILRKSLAMAKKLAEIFTRTSEEKAQLEEVEVSPGVKYRTKDMVRDDILVGENFFNKLPGITRHRQQILDAFSSGQTVEATDYLLFLRKFAQSQLNKLGAFNEAARTGVTSEENGLSYQAVNPSGQFFDIKEADQGYRLEEGAWFNPAVPNSVALAREVEIDARAVVDTYNTIYAELVDSLGLQNNKNFAPLSMEPLAAEISEAVSAPIEGEPDGSKPERRIRKDARGPVGRQSLIDETDTFDSDGNTVPNRVLVGDPDLPKRLKNLRQFPLEGPVTESELKYAERIQKPAKPEQKRPETLKEFVTQQGGFWLEDANIGEARALGYRRPGFFKRERLRTTSSGLSDNKGGRTSDELTEAAIEAGFLPAGSTISDLFTALDEDIRGNSVVRESDLGLQQEWDVYDNPEIQNPETVALAEREKRRAAWAAVGALPQPRAPRQETQQTQRTQQNQETARTDDSRTRETEQQAPVAETQEEAPAAEDQVSSEEVIESAEPDTTLDVLSEDDTLVEVEEARPSEETSAGQAEVDEKGPERSPPPAVAWLESLKKLAFGAMEGVNYFLKAFKARSEGSTLTAHEDPAQFVLENIDNLVTDQNGLSRELNDAEKRVVKQLVSQGASSFAQQLTQAFIQTMKQKGWEKKLDIMLSFPEAQIANFMVKGENGKTQLDRRVAQATYMAINEWMFETAFKGRPYMDDEAVSKALGRGRFGTVSAEDRKAVQSGLNQQTAINEIARKIETLLGVEPTNKISATRSQGIFRHMAANALMIAEKNGVVRRNDPYKYTNGKGEQKSFVTLNLDPKFVGDPSKGQKPSGVVKTMKAMPDVFTRIFTSGHSKARFVGSPPESISRTQLGNRLAKLSKWELYVVERLQQTRFTINSPMVDLIEALGDDVYMRLMGYQDIPKTMNKVDAASQEGKNTSLRSALDGLRGYLAEVEEEASATGSSRDAVSIFFSWRVSSVARLQQQGPITPQGDKTIRETISATWSDLDLESNEEHIKTFWLAVAQSLGISIEKQPHAESVREAQEMINGALQPAVEALEGYLKNGKLENFSIPSELEMTPKALHAMLDVARMNVATQEGGLASFRSALAIEADGKTDGPINAMIHMATGRFDEKEIERLAKGGLFFTSQPMSLSQFMAEEQRVKNVPEKHKDLYQMAAEVFHRDLLQAVSSSEDLNQTMAVLEFLSQFLPDFEMQVDRDDQNQIQDINFTIERNITKNPLTVFLYGSGANGIAGKIFKAAMKDFYKMLSQIAAEQKAGTYNEANHASKIAAFRNLFGQQFADAVLKNPSQFELKSQAEAQLTELVEKEFAEPMLKSIDETTGGLAQNMQLVQTASQVQAYLFQNKLEAALNARLQEKRKSGELLKTEELSEQDMQEVFEETMRVAPIYGTSVQEFHIAAQNRAPIDRTVSQSLDGRFSSKLTVLGAKDPSVKVSPYTTIGTGDGRMMIEIYANADGTLDTSLAVFDGVELASQNAVAGSRQINESVFKAWMASNVFQSVQEGFSQILGEISSSELEALPEKARISLSKAVGRTQKLENVSKSDLTVLNNLLQKAALESEARKYAISQMATQTDHMASAEAPYANGTEVTSTDNPTSYSEIAEKLNQLAREYMERRLKEIETERQKPVVQEPDPALQKFLEKQSDEVENHPNVKKVPARRLVTFLRSAKNISREQLSLVRGVMSSPAFKDITFYFGEEQALADMRDDLYWKIPKAPIKLGLFSAHYGGVVLATNAAPETVLHEILHSHTFETLVAYYNDPTSVPEETRDAVKRMESLLETTMNMELGADLPALLTLRGEIQRLSGNRAAQMSEFISWMLTNQNLIELGQEKRVFTPISDVIRKGLEVLKRLLGIEAGPGRTLFSNIRFNAEVIAATPLHIEEAKQNAVTNEVLNQVYPDNPRLARIENQFIQRMVQYLNAERKEAENRQSKRAMDEYHLKVATLKKEAHDAAELANFAGYGMNPRQAYAFEAIHAAIQSGMKLDPSLFRQVNELYTQTIKSLKAEDFLGENYTQTEYAEAVDKVRFLASTDGIRTNKNNQSDLLATFIALGMVNDDLRAALAKKKTPKVLELETGSIDGFVSRIGKIVVDLLTRLSLRGVRNQPNVKQELDVLADALSAIENERRFLSTAKIFAKMDVVNDYASEQLSRASKKAVKFVDDQSQRFTNQRVKNGFEAAKFVAALGDKDLSAAYGEGLTTILNASPNYDAVRALIREFRGVTDANRALMRLVNPVRAMIDAIRQDSREKMPKELAKRFSRKLTREEWNQLYALGEADVLALGQRRALGAIKSQATVQKQIAGTEERIRVLGRKTADLYMEKANALAHYMVKKEVISKNLLPNAHAIAYLFNESTKLPHQVTPNLIQAIDELTSLYAFQKLDPDVQNKIFELMDKEPDGMNSLVAVLNTTRQAEIERRDRLGLNKVAQNNGWKGFIPSVVQEGSQVVVRDIKDDAIMLDRGYVRLGRYYGDQAEGYKGKRYYYQSTVSAMNTFRQGIAQTVHETFSGVDSRTGLTYHGSTAGIVRGSRVARLSRRKISPNDNKLPPGEYLIPRFDKNGDVQAYERPMDPKMLKGIKRDTHLGRMLGVWAGRIVEETAADDFNKQLIETLKEIYDREKDKPGAVFVNVADPKQGDAVIKDAWDTLGWQIKAHAAATFGQANFVPVRRDMVDDAIGFRSAGVTDFWTGTSRWSPENQKRFRQFARRMIGNNAFKYLAIGDQTINDAVSFAKTNIVVRSVVVAYGNLISNVLQLMNNGIGFVEALGGMRDKFVELTEYVRNKEEISRLQIDLAANFSNVPEQRRLEAQIQALNDANSKMSIKPLIDAGEFSTISENLTEADVAIREGRWSDLMENATDRLPEWSRGVAKNLLITKDTALFQGLNRFVQYGDFVAKAVLYDHMTKTKKMEKQEALDEIFEEFVAYNRLPGRGRDFVENHGLLWFYNYKLRITKIMMKNVRERPLNSLLLMGVVGPALDQDTLWSGSLPGNIADGDLGYSIGPGMGWDSMSLNPWWNLVN